MKRWALRICVFLILGAIVNVAVGWGCGLFSAIHEDTTTTVDPASHTGDHWLVKEGHAQLHSVERVIWHGFGATWTVVGCRFEVPPGDQYPVVLVADVFLESGWPLASLGKTTQLDVTKGWDGEHIGLSWPLRPIWPGFAINTLLYAVGLWGLFAGPFVVRRWRRIRRGLCPKCAYDLRATQAGVCPECGATR